MDNWIIKKLKESGHKNTKPRQIVAEELITREGVFSAKELNMSAKIDLVSVYRTFDLFAELDIIHSVISIHGEEHYELHDDIHHHHVVCRECEKTKCVSCDLPEKKIKGFGSVHHSVVFTGLCFSCK